MSTTTIGRQVHALEDQLGVRLLNRTTRRVSLTKIDRDYYERCLQILQELNESGPGGDRPAGDAARPAAGLLPLRGWASLSRAS